MYPGHNRGTYTPLYVSKNDRRITMNEWMCYQCATIKGNIHLLVSVPGGIHISIPIKDDIALDDLASLCDRAAFCIWGIHGQYGVYGIEVPTADLENA